MDHKTLISDSLKKVLEDLMDKDEYFVVMGHGDAVTVMAEGMPAEDIINYANKAIWEASNEWDRTGT